MTEFGTEIMLFGILALAVGGAMVFLRTPPTREAPPTFELEISRGGVHVVSGAPPAAFVQACADIATRHRLESGRIAEQPMGESARLVLSPEIPEQYHQAFRNTWTPPTSPGDDSSNRA